MENTLRKDRNYLKAHINILLASGKYATFLDI